MRPLHYPLLADENIGRGVVEHLRTEGRDVAHCRDSPGLDDRAVLGRAESEGRVVLTHDSDLATLVLREHVPVLGVIYVRPAHINAQFTLETLGALERQVGDVERGFILVADRRGERLKLRLRRW